ncbi:MAG TPA: lyase family protein, partial [Dissulfurispiraceae bacterium]|nr:lyase family protein [Dissulfurispiraceae bacterium]
MSEKYRIERDSMGEVKVPSDAYWGAQTQRAMENFAADRLTLPEVFVRSVAIIKYAAAVTNTGLGGLPGDISDAILRSCKEIMEGKLAGQFPLGVFQTGSGTSTNMNVNEVAATRANELLTGHKHSTAPVHPNDHVNMGQSSNDVIPSAIRIAAYLEVDNNLLPALRHLFDVISQKQQEYDNVIKTGRTHLMDAVPVTFGQEISGWAAQIRLGLH